MQDRAPTSEETQKALMSIGWKPEEEIDPEHGDVEFWECETSGRTYLMHLYRDRPPLYTSPGGPWPLDFAAKTAAALGYSSTGYSLEEIERAFADELHDRLLNDVCFYDSGEGWNRFLQGLKERLQHHHTGEQQKDGEEQ